MYCTVLYVLHCTTYTKQCFIYYTKLRSTTFIKLCDIHCIILHVLHCATHTFLCCLSDTVLHELLYLLHCVTCTELYYIHYIMLHVLHCTTYTAMCYMYYTVLHVLHCYMHCTVLHVSNTVLLCATWTTCSVLHALWYCILYTALPYITTLCYLNCYTVHVLHCSTSNAPCYMYYSAIHIYHTVLYCATSLYCTRCTSLHCYASTNCATLVPLYYSVPCCMY